MANRTKLLLSAAFTLLCCAVIIASITFGIVQRHKNACVWAADVYKANVPGSSTLAPLSFHVVNPNSCTGSIAKLRGHDYKTYVKDCAHAEVLFDAELDFCLRHGEWRLVKPSAWKDSKDVMLDDRTIYPDTNSKFKGDK